MCLAPTYRDINRDKFKEVTSPLLTNAGVNWVDALRNVGRQALPKKIDHPWSNLFRGYVFPDYFYFANNYDQRPHHMASLLVVWLFIRPGWKAKFSAGGNFSDSLNGGGKLKGTPSPQQWKDFLGRIGVSLGIEPTNAAQPQHHSRPVVKKQKVRETKAFEDDFDFQVDTSKWPIDLYWDGGLVRGRDVAFSVPLGVSTLREVVWELCENNWRMECLTLDRCVVPREKMTTMEQSERDTKVGRVFPSSQFIIHQMPMRDEGLGALRWNDRAEFVEAFRQLLCDWPGRDAQRLATMIALQTDGPGQGHTASQQEVAAVEAVAYPFYFRTFLQYFGRAATIPRPKP